MSTYQISLAVCLRLAAEIHVFYVSIFEGPEHIAWALEHEIHGRFN